jgi:hypothetical protein
LKWLNDARVERNEINIWIYLIKVNQHRNSGHIDQPRYP